MTRTDIIAEWLAELLQVPKDSAIVRDTARRWVRSRPFRRKTQGALRMYLASLLLK